ncbi:Rne/Rng family ribonuclease, partial [uncultured Desulfuromonas sp.]|uniref:Rne/Rng family ribonuclease n=1 Tax=uncultured Desulfuromonas sp. TaxID=181013 RepID=UPI0026108A17
MSRKMLINATLPEENRVAIVEEGILTELDIEIAGKEQTKGNIYKAVVVRVETGLQAAFVDFGGERLGFLQMGEIHPSYYQSSGNDGEGNRRPRIGDVLRRGMELQVQIVKEERGTKGAALTTYLSLPGRYMVLMPGSDTRGISRKIEEESQRKKIKQAMASLELPEKIGYIVRTAGIGQKKEELKRDFQYLLRVYENIQALSKKVKAPALVYQESNLVIRSLRDYFSADVDEVLVDDAAVFQEARDFFQQVMPEYAKLVKLHQERRPIFSRYQIEEQIETIAQNKVALPSGGSIVIDPTEALVAIDVNSGKMAGEQGIEATATRTNLEAATEVGRQLRLRDLGGLIVIDFIDMRDRKHIRDVEKNLKDALKSDKARVTVGRISQFGLLEMSRQRIKSTLAAGAYLGCPHCNGTGKVKSPEAQAVALLRRIHAGVAKGQVARVNAEVPLEVSTYLLNTKREELLQLERQYDITIHIKGHPGFVADQADISLAKRDKDAEKTGDVAQVVTAAAGLEAPPAPAAETAPAAQGEGQEAAQPPAEGEGGKRRRRRRRNRKRPAETTPGQESAAAEAAPQEEAMPETPPEAAPTADEKGPEGEEEEKPRSRRRRRRRRSEKTPSAETVETGGADKTEATAPVEPPSQPEALVEQPSQPEAPVESAPESVTEEKPKPAPKRRAPRKKAEKKPAEAAAPETAVAEKAAAPEQTSEAAPEAPAEEKPKPAPKRRAPRKKAEKKPAEAAAPETAVAEK